jgi:RimJ/RimL family protein N-acetyltransferase
LKDTLILEVRSQPGLRLRSAALGDAQRLRLWKNANRRGFFFKGEITPEGQLEWMRRYFERDGDYMFVVEHAGEPIGCMAFRLVDGAADVYNVILGNREFEGRGLMSAAFREMLAFARRRAGVVGLKVLKDNPAIRFYERNGFAVNADHGDHLDMTLDWARLE